MQSFKTFVIQMNIDMFLTHTCYVFVGWERYENYYKQWREGGKREASSRQVFKIENLLMKLNYVTFEW